MALRTFAVVSAIVGTFFALVDAWVLAAPAPEPRGAEIITVYRKDLKRYEAEWDLTEGNPLSQDETRAVLDRLKPLVCPAELHGTRVAVYLGDVGDYGVMLWTAPGTSKAQRGRLNELVKEVHARVKER